MPFLERLDFTERGSRTPLLIVHGLMITGEMFEPVIGQFATLAEITCPTLVVAASNDDAVPVHHAKMLHDGITGSELVIIDRANHAIIWTRPEEFVRATEELLGA